MEHSDIVMLRGGDTYPNLPNKTVGPSLFKNAVHDEPVAQLGFPATVLFKCIFSAGEHPAIHE